MRISSALFLVGLMGLIGCGGDDESAETTSAGEDSAQSAAPATSPAGAQQSMALTGCGWITEADVSSAFGKPMRYRSNDPESTTCIVDQADQVHALSVDFRVREGSANFELERMVEMLYDVGDEAAWIPGDLISTLVADKGNRTLEITISDPSKKTSDMKDKAVTLAKLIVEKM